MTAHMIHKLLQPQISAVLALIVYGSWAAFSNVSYGYNTVLIAFLIQGGYAFVSTLALGVAVIHTFRRLGSSRAARIGSFLLGFTVLCTVPAGLHVLAGTPNIVQSILPGLIWGTGYLVLLLRTQCPVVAS